MEPADQAATPASPCVNVDQASNPPPEHSTGDGPLVRHPASHRYEIAYLLSLRSLPASQKPPEGSSQLNSAMRWANNSRRTDSGLKPPVRSGRFGSEELQQPNNAQPLLGYQSEAAGQGSLLGMPAHLRPQQQQKSALKAAAGGGLRKAAAENAEAEPQAPEQAEEDFGRRTDVIFGPENNSFLPTQANKFVDDELKQIGKSQLGLHPAGFQWDQRQGQGFAHGGAASASSPPRPPAVNAAGGAFGGYVPRLVDMGPNSRPFDNNYYPEPQNTWEHDPWDSPVDQGDVNDIFTLGDIRQAEHTIETQGISAESYANFRTRKILNDQADRRRPANAPGPEVNAFAPQSKGMSPDIFFGDGRPPAMGGDRAPPGESRFLSMFNENAQSAAAHDQRAPTPRTLTATREQLQNQAISVLQNLPYHQQQQIAANWMAQQAESKSAGEKAQMREHLLKLLGLQKQHPQQNDLPPQADPVYKQYQANAATAATRPPGMTFSKPLNPAAPNFAPSGLYNPNVNNDHMKRGNGANMAPPPMDFRRGQMGFEHSPNHHMGPNQSGHYPPAGWNQRVPHPHSPPMDDYGTMGNHPAPPMNPSPAAHPDIQDLIQKLLARQKTGNQHPASDQHAAATQALHRSLAQAGNLTHENVQAVLNYLRTTKQFTMNPAAANPNARRNAGMQQQAKPEGGMMGQQGRPAAYGQQAPQTVGANPQNPQGLPAGQHPAATLSQLLGAQALINQVSNSSPHGARGGPRPNNESQKTMAALIQTLTKATQQRAGTPAGGAPAGGPAGTSKHIQLSNCLDQLQGNQAMMKKSAAAVAAANQQSRGGYIGGPPPQSSQQGPVGGSAASSSGMQQQQQQQSIGPPGHPQRRHGASSSFGMDAESGGGAPPPSVNPAAVAALGGLPAMTKPEQHAALATLLRNMPTNHPLYNQIQQLLRQQRDLQERQERERLVAAAEQQQQQQQAAAAAAAAAAQQQVQQQQQQVQPQQSSFSSGNPNAAAVPPPPPPSTTTASSNNGVSSSTAPPTTTTSSTTGPHTSNSCENKENGGSSEVATTENCSSPTTAAPPAKDEVVAAEANEQNSPRQVSADE